MECACSASHLISPDISYNISEYISPDSLNATGNYKNHWAWRGDVISKKRFGLRTHSFSEGEQ
jgi:hypothetical protein